MTNTRRDFFFSVLGGAAMFSAARASTYGRVLKAGKPKLIPGNPNMVDFGHGLLVPMNHEAFDTLWEGDDRWMSYGMGVGRSEGEAMGRAEEAATGTMKLFLLTLAFKPERLEQIAGGGWRLKSHNVADLVRGDIYLPGRPIMPTVDMVGGTTTDDAANSDQGGENSRATTGWVVWKSEVKLDYVRDHATLADDQPAPPPHP
jgi:hypothetical protein